MMSVSLFEPLDFVYSQLKHAYSLSVSLHFSNYPLKAYFACSDDFGQASQFAHQ